MPTPPEAPQTPRKLALDELARKSPEEFRQAEKLPIVLLLDNVRSMANVGSVFRTSDAFLVEHLYLCGITGQPPHREIQKTALGSTDSVAWSHHPAAAVLAKELKAAGYTLVAFEQTTHSAPLKQLEMNFEKVALVFGNEVKGVQDDLVQLADHLVEIPQYGTKHSLNIAVAAGIGLHHFASHFVESGK